MENIFKSMSSNVFGPLVTSTATHIYYAPKIGNVTFLKINNIKIRI